jgi:hypothetical protein
MWGHSCLEASLNEAILADECFSFGPLPFLISTSTAFLPFLVTIYFPGSKALDTKESLIQSKNDVKCF